MLKLLITVEWDTDDHVTSYTNIEVKDEYYSDGKLLMNKMDETESDRVWNEIHEQVSDQVTWMWDVPDWEIVKAELDE